MRKTEIVSQGRDRNPQKVVPEGRVVMQSRQRQRHRKREWETQREKQRPWDWEGEIKESERSEI